MLLTAATETARSEPGWGTGLFFLLFFGGFLVMLFLVMFGEEVFELLRRRQELRANLSPRTARLHAVEFVAQHPELRALGDAEAMTVAGVLRATLQEQAKQSRRFDVLLAATGLFLGALAGHYWT